MNLKYEQHFHEMVLPAWEAYLIAEDALTAAYETADAGQIKRAGFRALREGGAAAFYLNHFADIVLAEQPPQLPEGTDSLRKVRSWVTSHCRHLRSNQQLDDVQLLADVADALKHAKLRDGDRRQIEANDAVLVTDTGWGQGLYGEGKFGWPEQVIILAKSGRRVLSGVLQNVIDAWRNAMGWPLPEIGSVFEGR